MDVFAVYQQLLAGYEVLGTAEIFDVLSEVGRAESAVCDLVMMIDLVGRVRSAGRSSRRSG